MLVEELAAALSALLKYGGQGIQILAALRQRLQFMLEYRTNGIEKGVAITYTVIAPGPLALHRQDPGLGQDLQVPRDARLPHTEDAGQLLHGEFTTQQYRCQTQAARVSQGFQ